MRILIATDAWHPQVNGVVRSLSTTVDHLLGRGFDAEAISPDQYGTIGCPTYPEIRLAVGCGRKVARRMDAFAPIAVHIATEGPLGWAARAWCLKRRVPYTSSFHTRFPDYVAMRTGLPPALLWSVMRRFHGPAARTFAVTPSLAAELEGRGITRTHHWPLGVDLSQFTPDAPLHPRLAKLPRPILLNVGRVAPEKNLEAFLDLRSAGSKVVVGEGPALESLRGRYPDVHFLGAMHGAELTSIYASADLFVFPSRTDTFGLVNIEALASGLPVAAFPVPGPVDIIGRDGLGVHGRGTRIGAVDEDLQEAVNTALTAERRACIAEAANYDWARCTDRFVAGLEPRAGTAGLSAEARSK